MGNIENDAIIRDIALHNNLNDKINAMLINHKYLNKKTNKCALSITINAKTYDVIMSNKKLFIGSCRL